MNLEHEGLSPEEAIWLGARIEVCSTRWVRSTKNHLFDLHENAIKPALQITGNRVLEIGVGTGKHLISYRGVDYTGVDIHEPALAAARVNARDFGMSPEKIIASFPKELPFGTESFDRVLSVCTLHEVEDLGNLLNEMDRVLAKKGRVVIVERMTAYSESPEAQARLKEEPVILPDWFKQRGYTTHSTMLKSTYFGESFTQDPKFSFYLLTAERNSTPRVLQVS